MRGTFPDPEKIKCKDCKYRDKTVVVIEGKAHYCGVTRGECEKYKWGETMGKPHDVLFQNADCEFYEQSKEG